MSYSDIFKDAALLQLTATCWSIDRKLPPALLAEVGNVDYLKGRKLHPKTGLAISHSRLCPRATKADPNNTGSAFNV